MELNYIDNGGIQDEFRSPFSDKIIRQGFIRKVYGILSVQILITFTPCLIFSHRPELLEFAQDKKWVSIFTSVAQLLIIVLLWLDKELRSKVPFNYIYMGLFTICSAISFSFIGPMVPPKLMSFLIGATLFLLVGLVTFAIQTKIDITICNGLMICFLLSLVASSFSLFFFENPNSFVIMGAFFATFFLFGSYIVIVTQQMASESSECQISPEDYVYAVLLLYVIIIVMVAILALIAVASSGNSSGSSDCDCNCPAGGCNGCFIVSSGRSGNSRTHRAEENNSFTPDQNLQYPVITRQNMPKKSNLEGAEDEDELEKGKDERNYN